MNQAEVKRRQAQTLAAFLSFVTFMIIAGLTGYNGVAYVAAAMEGYAFLCLAVCGGLSDALGRVLRIRSAKGQYRNAVAMRRNAFILQAVCGLLGAALLLFGADLIAVRLFRTQYSSALLMIFAPAVLLRSLSALFAGYSRGEGAELPAAVASILRQIFVLGFSVMFSRMLGDYGDKVSHLLAHANFTSMYGGIGVAIAVTLAEAFVALFLFLIYKGSRRAKNREFQEGMRTTDSLADSVRILSGNRSTQIGLELLLFLPVPLGMVFWQKAMDSSESAAIQYGVYIAGYGAVCGLVVSAAMLPLIPICGRIIGLLRKDEIRYAKSVFQNGVHMGAVYTAFPAAFVTLMAEQIGAVFCGEQAAVAAKMLRGGASVVLFSALSFFFARLLIQTGKRYLVMGAVAAADVCFIVAVTVFLGAGKAGILSLVYGGMLVCGVLCIVLGAFAYRVFRQRVDWLQVFVVPVAVACVAGLIAMLLGRVLVPHLGNLFTTVICLALTYALYWVMLLLVRNFREQELEVIPGGKLLGILGQMLRVF